MIQDSRIILLKSIFLFFFLEEGASIFYSFILYLHIFFCWKCCLKVLFHSLIQFGNRDYSSRVFFFPAKANLRKDFFRKAMYQPVNKWIRFWPIYEMALDTAWIELR